MTSQQRLGPRARARRGPLVERPLQSDEAGVRMQATERARVLWSGARAELPLSIRWEVEHPSVWAAVGR